MPFVRLEEGIVRRSVHSAGKMGSLNPADEGNFEVNVPDFTEDPALHVHALRAVLR